MTAAEAWAVVGGLSAPSKMPCAGYSLPAAACHVGQLLARVQGTICSACYAGKGRYAFPRPRRAMQRRLASLSHPRWVEAMSALLNRPWYHGGPMPWFRWHDSGDLQSPAHLRAILAVCRATPDTRHWLPTREAGILASVYQQDGAWPANLTVRLSAARFDARAAEGLARRLGIQVSEAGSDATCPAPTQGNACHDCRRCWNRRVFRVRYARH